MSDVSKWACVFRPAGFGDNIIASSVFNGLKRKYGHLEVIAAKPISALYENHPAIDKLTLLEPGMPQWGDGHQWQKWHTDRAKEYTNGGGAYYNLSHSCESLGVSMRIETKFWWNQEMRRKLMGRSYLELVHDICEIPYGEISPNVYPTQEEQQQAIATKAQVGPRCVGWVLTGSRIDKVHPQADVAIARVIKELQIPVIMFGAPGKDMEFAKLIQKEVKKLNHTDDGLHLALSPDPENPSWAPRRICAQAQLCDVVVGPDTGPMWAVAMHPMPKIMMASHAGKDNITKHWVNTITLHANQTRVPCFPCHRLHDDSSMCTPNVDKNGSACISDISVDDLVSSVKAALSGSKLSSGDLQCGVVSDSYNESLLPVL